MQALKTLCNLYILVMRLVSLSFLIFLVLLLGGYGDRVLGLPARRPAHLLLASSLKAISLSLAAIISLDEPTNLKQSTI